MEKILVTNSCIHAITKNDICTNCNKLIVDVYVSELPHRKFCFTADEVAILKGEKPQEPESKYLLVERAKFMELLSLIQEKELEITERDRQAVLTRTRFQYSADDAFWNMRKVGLAASDLLKASKPYSDVRQ